MVEEWVEQCRNGQTRAYALVVKALQPQILGFLYRMTQSREWAEDLGQEVFLRAYRQIHQYDPRKAKFSTWLFTLARNLCLDELRKRRIPSVSLNDEMQDTLSADDNPGGLVEEKEMAQRIAVAVRELEPEFQEIFILREYQDLSLDEITQITGCPLGTVKSRLHRARMQLQEKLAPILNV